MYRLTNLWSVPLRLEFPYPGGVARYSVIPPEGWIDIEEHELTDVMKLLAKKTPTRGAVMTITKIAAYAEPVQHEEPVVSAELKEDIQELDEDLEEEEDDEEFEDEDARESEEDDPVHFCDVCGRDFTSKRGLASHRKVHGSSEEGE